MKLFLFKKGVGVDIPILQVKIGLNFGTWKAEFVNDGRARRFVKLSNFSKGGYGKGIDGSQSDGYRGGSQGLKSRRRLSRPFGAESTADMDRGFRSGSHFKRSRRSFDASPHDTCPNET